MPISNTVQPLAPKKYTSSPGAYKGIAINPGTSKDVSDQVAKIDTPAAPKKPVKGLLPDVKGSVSKDVAKPLSFSGLVGGLQDASRPSQVQNDLNTRLAGASSPTSTQTGLVKDLSRIGRDNVRIGQDARNISEMYGNEIANIGKLGAGAQAGYLSSGNSVVGAGNAQIASQSASARMNALAAAQEAALKGTGQQLTGQSQYASATDAALGGANTQQGQQLSGLGTALGSANTQQAQQLSGLGAAAGYAQPQVGAIGGVPYSPLDLSQSAILGTTQPGGVAAAGNLLGQLQGAQAVGAAPGQTQATNYQTLGTAQTSGLAQGIQAVNAAPGTAQAGVIGTQTQQIAGYQSALQQGQNLQAQLTDLIRTFGLNPADVNAANQGIQKIASNVSSPQYQILQNYVNDIANTYSQILTPPGGSATDTTRGIAASMLDRTAKGESIVAVMRSLDEAAKAKIAGVSTTPASAPSSAPVNPSGTNGQSTRVGNYNYIYQNGKWVVAQ